MKKTILSLIALFIILLILGSFLLLTHSGNKIANQIYPTAFLTVKLTEASLSKISNYSESTTLGIEEHISLKTTVFSSGNSTSDVLFPIPYASSTLNIPGQKIQQKIVYQGGEVYTQDPYDKQFYKADTTITPQEVITFIKTSGLLDTLLKVSNHKDVSVKKGAGNDIEISSTEGKFVVDSTTYLPKSFEISRAKVQIDTYNQNISPQSVKITEGFGDFISRESFFIRIEDKGIHDNMFSDWEKRYFNCTHCVNQFADNDKDGLLNVFEFIFNTNPLSKTNKNSEISELDLLNKGMNPTTGAVFDAQYKKSVEVILAENKLRNLSSIPSTSNGPGYVGVNKAIVRSSYVSVPFIIPAGTKRLSFDYIFKEIPPYNKSYVTIFINDTFITALDPIKTSDLQHKIINVESFAGKNIRFNIGLNSVGENSPDKKQSQFEVHNIAFVR